MTTVFVVPWRPEPVAGGYVVRTDGAEQLSAAMRRLDEVRAVLADDNGHVGFDPNRIAKVTIDGAGRVSAVEFDRVVARFDDAAVGAAVVAALGAAEAERVRTITERLGGEVNR